MGAGRELSRRIEALDPIEGDLRDVAAHPWAEELCREITVEPAETPTESPGRHQRRRRLLAPVVATAALLLAGGGALAGGLIHLPGSDAVVARPGITVPTISVSPVKGPVGTLITVSGRVPTRAPCAYARLTIARPAAGAAALERAVRPSAGRYHARIRIPAILLPTQPPSIARNEAIRVVCVPSPTSTASRAPSVAVIFRVVSSATS